MTAWTFIAIAIPVVGAAGIAIGLIIGSERAEARRSAHLFVLGNERSPVLKREVDVPTFMRRGGKRS